MNAEQRARRRAEQIATIAGSVIAAVAYVGGPLFAAAIGIPRDASFLFVVGTVLAGLAVIIAAPLINRREVRALRRSLAEQYPDSDVRLVFFTEPEGFRRIAVLVVGPTWLTLNVRGENEPRVAVPWDAVSSAHAENLPRGNSAILVVNIEGEVDQRLVVLADNSILPRRASVVHQLAAHIKARARGNGGLPKPSERTYAKVARVLPLPARIAVHGVSVLLSVAAVAGMAYWRDPVIENTMLNVIALIAVANVLIIIRTSDAMKAARLGS